VETDGPDLANGAAGGLPHTMGDWIYIIIFLLIAVPVVALAVHLAWWAFRMVFFITLIFIGEAGKAWRGE
jgi:hypothetical protein